jgi:hypothetical protein
VTTASEGIFLDLGTLLSPFTASVVPGKLLRSQEHGPSIPSTRKSCFCAAMQSDDQSRTEVVLNSHDANNGKGQPQKNIINYNEMNYLDVLK